VSYSYTLFSGTGSTTLFTFPFPYIKPEHVNVLVDGVATSYTYINSNAIKIEPAPANGKVIEIRRDTPKDTPPVNFTDGSVLLEADLDLLAMYATYISQEIADANKRSIYQTSTGEYTATGQRISNVADPINPQDVVTKNFNDTVYTPFINAQVVAATTQATSSATSASQSATSATSSAASATASASSKAAAAVSATAAALSETNAGVTATAVATSATAADASKVAAAASATAADGSKVAAASSATTASIASASAGTFATNSASSATQADASASTATTQAATATTKASEASTSATNAASSATASASSATAAADSAASISSSTIVSKTSPTGSAGMPSGTTAQRPTPVVGQFRFNSDLNQFEGYNGTAWGAVGGGATGGVGNAAFYENDQTITADYSITSGKNAMSAGLITINNGVTVTIPDNSTWTIV